MGMPLCTLGLPKRSSISPSVRGCDPPRSISQPALGPAYPPARLPVCPSARLPIGPSARLPFRPSALGNAIHSPADGREDPRLSYRFCWADLKVQNRPESNRRRNLAAIYKYLRIVYGIKCSLCRLWMDNAAFTLIFERKAFKLRVRIMFAFA
jgi:hypothetical protein